MKRKKLSLHVDRKTEQTVQTPGPLRAARDVYRCVQGFEGVKAFHVIDRHGELLGVLQVRDDICRSRDIVALLQRLLEEWDPAQPKLVS